MTCKHCPTCGQPLPNVDPFDEILALLNQYCRDNSISIDWNGSITEESAAKLLSRDARTISNWRYSDCPIPFSRIRGRVRYRLVDLARFIADEQQKNLHETTRTT